MEGLQAGKEESRRCVAQAMKAEGVSVEVIMQDHRFVGGCDRRILIPVSAMTPLLEQTHDFFLCGRHRARKLDRPRANQVSENTPKELVDAYLAARAAHDHDLARRFLADRGFAFRSPVVDFDSADDLHEWASLTGGIVRGMEVRKVFVDGEDVCHILTYHYQLSEKAAGDVVHWARVRDGRIRRIEVFFDSYRYRALFDPRLS